MVRIRKLSTRCRHQASPLPNSSSCLHVHTLPVGPSSNKAKERQIFEDGSGNSLRTMVLKLEYSLESPPGLVNIDG